MKKRFTKDDMKVAYEAGVARIMWEDGYIRGEERPTFEDFIKDYKEK